MLAVAGIVVKGGRVLLCRRPQGVFQGGLWEFPTFGLEGDETLEDSLERNLFDCFALHLEPSVFLGVAEREGVNPMRIFSYGLKTENFPKEIRGYSRYKWLRPKELRYFRLSSAGVTAIKGLKNF